MKIFLTIILMMSAVLGQAQDSPLIFKFKNLPVADVLQVYGTLIDKKLVIEHAATNQTTSINLETPKPVLKKEAAKLIETALREQASVVIEPLDDKSVTVKLGKK